MSQSELEKKLKRSTLRRRLILLAVFVAFLTLGIVFTVLYNSSRQEETIDGSPLLPSYTYETYNYSYISGQVIGYVVVFYVAVFLIVDLLCWTFKTVQAGDSFITIYRGGFKIAMYIDGELVDAIYGFRHYLEGKLKDGSTVSASFGRWSGRMVFTNGHAPIDIDYWFGND